MLLWKKEEFENFAHLVKVHEHVQVSKPTGKMQRSATFSLGELLFSLDKADATDKFLKKSKWNDMIKDFILNASFKVNSWLSMNDRMNMKSLLV